MAGNFLRVLPPSARAAGAPTLLFHSFVYRFFAFAIAIWDKKVLGF
jgi:hypothetical protein